MTLYAELERELEGISKWPWKIHNGDVWGADGSYVCQLHFEGARNERFILFSPERIRALLDHWAEAEARAMRAEFRLQHRVDGRADLIWCSKCSMDDSRHDWSKADWLAAAKEKLKEVDHESKAR